MASPRKVIIDTDAGADDALALFLALVAHKDPKVPFEIVGITTVLGNTDVDHVCRNVFIVLDYAGVTDIPVYRGAAKPLVQPFDRHETPYHGKDGFGEIDLSKITMKRGVENLEKETGPLALVRLAREHKGKLTVVALGPLTNLAIALNIDPEFATNVKDLYVMGGNIHGIGNISPCSEFNFFADPEAVFVVFDAEWNEKMVLIPWETCKLAKSNLEWRRDVFGTIKSKQVELLNMVEDKLLTIYSERNGCWVNADSVCVAVLLNPDIVTQKTTNHCTIELQGYHTRGQMVVDHTRRSGKKHNAIIIEEISTPVLEKMITTIFEEPNFPQDL